MRLLVAIAMIGSLAAVGCDQDPELGPSLDDVQKAAPDVCTDWCTAVTDCGREVASVEGVEEANAYQHEIDACVLSCAFSADAGVYVYESEHDGEGNYTYDIKKVVAGDAWLDYFECLWISQLWSCDDEHGHYTIVIENADDCAMYDECVQYLDINQEWEWHEDSEGVGHCWSDGDEMLWGDWD